MFLHLLSILMAISRDFNAFIKVIFTSSAGEQVGRAPCVDMQEVELVQLCRGFRVYMWLKYSSIDQGVDLLSHLVIVIIVQIVLLNIETTRRAGIFLEPSTQIWVYCNSFNVRESNVEQENSILHLC